MRSTLTLTAVLLFGCQTAPAVKEQKLAGGEVVLSLQRTPCFGACPVYLVEVLGDGTLRFKGARHVKITEPVELKLEPATLQRLFARLDGSDFAGWPDYTKVDATDAPTVVLTYKGHTVRHYRGDDAAPAELTKLEDDVDALLGTERWTKGTGAQAQ